eukprot:4795084-Amphidinium_carterae.1
MNAVVNGWITSANANNMCHGPVASCQSDSESVHKLCWMSSKRQIVISRHHAFKAQVVLGHLLRDK